MPDYTVYANIFPAGAANPYDRKLQQEIEVCRKDLDGVLFIDRVLKALGISKGKAYPPKTEATNRQLHQQICEAPMSMHHKLSLLYYILLDFTASEGRTSLADNFAAEFGMPRNYQIFMKGLWFMDRHEFAKALEYVTHPSLIPDFADDILIALIRHAAEDDDYSLALSYFYTVRPNLKSSTALELLFDAMAQTNVTEALLYSRTYPDHSREQLFRRLVSSVLEGGHGDEAAERTSELAFLPFDPTEETWFEEYLSTGEGRSLKKAKDTLLIRRIACDRFAEAGKLRAGGAWAPVLEGIKAGIEGHEE